MSDPNTTGRIQAIELCRLLDKFGSDLADDLEWALGLLAQMPKRPDENTAKRYVAAHRHLKARRLYEKCCEEIADVS